MQEMNISFFMKLSMTSLNSVQSLHDMPFQYQLFSTENKESYFQGYPKL